MVANHERDYKQHLKVNRPLNEIADTELENLWWNAFRRDDMGTVFCAPDLLRKGLERLLKQ